jgi:ligand-binding SRPBCC domain-containing protein
VSPRADDTEPRDAPAPGGSAKAFERTSFLPGALPDEVWRAVSSWDGVNAELAPVRMHFPPPFRDLEAIPADGRVHATATLTVFGLPFDRHRFALTACEPGHHFHEVSSNFLLRRWVHRRSLEASAGGVQVTDRCELEPRLALLGPILSRVYEAVFDRRHARLRRRFPQTRDRSGGPSTRAPETKKAGGALHGRPSG